MSSRKVKRRRRRTNWNRSLRFLKVISTSVSVFTPEDFTSRMSVCENITLVNRRISCLLKKRLPQVQSVTFEMIFPFLLLETEKEKLETLLSEEAELLFGSESELRKTIKLFIENNSNVTFNSEKAASASQQPAISD
ncbi:transcriptional regulator [Bacillus subtilis]|nr:transcriptional regulator [Bacillus subtilis]